MLRTMVERISYDGRVRRILIRLHQLEMAVTGQEAQA
jgi:hypothetical protein